MNRLIVSTALAVVLLASATAGETRTRQLVGPTSPSQPAVSAPEAAAIAMAVGALPADDPLRAFYAARRMRAAWSGADAEVLIASIQDADRQALNPRDFLPDLDRERDPAQRDLKLSRAALA